MADPVASVPSFEWKRFRRCPWTDIDPRLRLAGEQEDDSRSAGTGGYAGPARGRDEPRLRPVLGMLTSDSAIMPDLVLRAVQRGATFTGLVDRGDLWKVRRHPSVASLKSALPIHRSLDDRTKAALGLAVGAIPSGRPPTLPRPPGSRSIVGVVDFNCAVAHPEFVSRGSPSKTRFLRIWDQRDPSDVPGPAPARFSYGREIGPEQIQTALDGAPPAESVERLALVQSCLGLPISPADDAHGTAVLALAAGTETGLAPEAELVFVRLNEDRANDATTTTRDLMDAIGYVFDLADAEGVPAVVCVSLEAHGGSHDGTGPLDRAIDHMTSTPGHAVVFAAGNAATKNFAARVTIQRDEHPTMRFEFVPARSAASSETVEMDLWYEEEFVNSALPRLDPLGLSKAVSIDVKVTAFGPGENAPSIVGPALRVRGPGRWTLWRHDADASGGSRPTRVLEVVHRARDPLNGANELLVSLRPHATQDRLDVELSFACARPKDTDARRTVRVDAWIDADPACAGSAFSTSGPDGACSVSGLACGRSTITVGASDIAHPDDPSVYPRSGFGRTRGPRGRAKPDLCAPGKDVEVVMLTPAADGTRTTPASGTSFAAPLVAGVIARIHAAAGARRVSRDELRALLLAAGREIPEPWRPEMGRVSVRADRVEDVAELVAHALELLASGRSVDDLVSLARRMIDSGP